MLQQVADFPGLGDLGSLWNEFLDGRTGAAAQQPREVAPKWAPLAGPRVPIDQALAPVRVDEHHAPALWRAWWRARSLRSPETRSWSGKQAYRHGDSNPGFRRERAAS